MKPIGEGTSALRATHAAYARILSSVCTHPLGVWNLLHRPQRPMAAG
jgi:hypothetical protein